MRERGGVYQIVNVLDGKIYVGCSIDVRRRFYLHKRMLRMGTHDNIHLQRAWKRDGETSFRFRIIEKVADKADLLKREKFWIDELECLTTGYNLCIVGRSQLGTKRSQEAIEKQRASMKGRQKTAAHKAKIGKANKGRKKSPEWRAKLSASVKAAFATRPELLKASSRGGKMTGGQNKGVPWTEAQRKKNVAAFQEAAKRPERYAQIIRASKLADKARRSQQQ